MIRYAMLISFILIFGGLSAQNLKLEEIMKGDEFIGNQPENHRWSFDGSTVFFGWNPENESGNSTYYWKEGMTKAEKYSLTEYIIPNSIFEEQYAFDTIYYINQGAIFSFQKSTGITQKIYHTSFPVSNLKRGAKGDELYFQQATNIWRMNVRQSSLVQLTNFKKSKEAAKPSTDNFLSRQQSELFQFIIDKEERKNWQDNKTNERKLSFPTEYIYGPDNLDRLTASSDGKYILMAISKVVEQTPTKVEHFITENGFTNNVSARAKVSVKNLGKSSLAIYSVEKDTVYFVDIAGLPGIKELPAYYKEYEHLKNSEKSVKAVSIQKTVFNSSGSEVVVEIKSQDNKDRWIVQLDVSNGKVRTLDHQHDEAWIGGPGIGYGYGTLGFLNDDETIYYQSEVSGYSHLYLINIRTNEKRQLTKGNWEVRDVKLSKDGNTFFLTTNTTHPGNRSFYKLDISTGEMIGYFTADGAYEVVVSPDEKKLLVRHSAGNKPWDLYIGDNKVNAELTQITHSASTDFSAYPWREPQVVKIRAQDGEEVFARLYTPSESIKNGAAVIFVHGAGYLQNAHNFWSSYHREYMFHNLLTDKGYTVLDIDYRGSDGYGRDVRTAIYRYMGGLDLSDHLDGKKFLTENYGIDTDRVGIYGGSYGGFITLMALLTKPGTFKAGAALRSVTDWAHYNHGYTSNILNFPETDSIAYRRSSPIYFAENLQDRLLMLHGMVDDNVQFQDIVRITQRFIEKGLKGWELAVYPVEAHGFRESYSWVDEYSRILQLFEETIGGIR